MGNKTQLNLWVRQDLKDSLAELATQQEQTSASLAAALLEQGIARLRGEIVEQQALPIIREIVATELRKTKAELRQDFHDDLRTELKEHAQRSDNRLAALIVRAIRESGIAWRLVYSLMARQTSTGITREAYEDAKAKAGASLKQPASVEE